VDIDSAWLSVPGIIFYDELLFFGFFIFIYVPKGFYSRLLAV